MATDVAPEVTTRPERRADKAAPLDPKEALELMLLNAHRLAVSLNDLGVFRNCEISVAEWAILKSLGGRQNVPIMQVSVSTGVSRQRLRKLVSELEQKGLVVTERSQTDDKRIRMISTTSTAAQVLSLISRQMEDLIPEAAGKRGLGRSLGIAARSMGKVARTIRRNWQTERAKGEAAKSGGGNAKRERLSRTSA